MHLYKRNNTWIVKVVQNQLLEVSKTFVRNLISFQKLFLHLLSRFFSIECGIEIFSINIYKIVQVWNEGILFWIKDENTSLVDEILVLKPINYIEMNNDMFINILSLRFVETRPYKSYLGFVSYDICWIIEILFHIRKVSSVRIKFLKK